MWHMKRSDEPLHRAIDEIIGPHRRRTPSHHDGRWRTELEQNGRFVAAAEVRLPFEQLLDRDGLVDRIGSISFIAALPDGDRAHVLHRIRELGESTAGPIRLGYTSEVFVYERA
jgi:hypothetical protein